MGEQAREVGVLDLPDAENISAVIVNPQGTLPKFNRLGYLAEFGTSAYRWYAVA